MAAAEKLVANPGLEKYHILSHMAQGVLFPRGLMHTKPYRLTGREGLAGVGDRPKTVPRQRGPRSKAGSEIGSVSIAAPHLLTV